MAVPPGTKRGSTTKVEKKNSEWGESGNWTRVCWNFNSMLYHIPKAMICTSNGNFFTFICNLNFIFFWLPQLGSCPRPRSCGAYLGAGPAKNAAHFSEENDSPQVLFSCMSTHHDTQQTWYLDGSASTTWPETWSSLLKWIANLLPKSKWEMGRSIQ